LGGDEMVNEEKIKIGERLAVPGIVESEFMCEECGKRVAKIRNFCGFGICEECYVRLLFKNQHEA
jgi:DNA-directed RNA polymerase subunit RPC12/RpoP